MRRRTYGDLDGCRPHLSAPTCLPQCVLVYTGVLVYSGVLWCTLVYSGVLVYW